MPHFLNMNPGDLPEGIRRRYHRAVDHDGNRVFPSIKFGTMETNRIRLAEGVDLVSKLFIHKVPAPNLIIQCGEEFFESGNVNKKGRPYELHELEDIGEKLREYCLVLPNPSWRGWLID